MTYPGNYSELSNDKKIIWLKKQREGRIIGGFRNCLCSVYTHIQVSCSKSKTLTCIYEEAFASIDIPGVFDPFEYCTELSNLGYIEMHHMNSLHILSILKEIDF